MTNVIVVIGAGSIGQAIARRVSAGKQVLLGDLRQGNAAAAAKTLIEAGFNVTAATVDVSSRASVHSLGPWDSWCAGTRRRLNLPEHCRWPGAKFPSATIQVAPALQTFESGPY